MDIRPEAPASDSAELFAANMAAFRQHFPQIAAKLEAIPERLTTRRPAPDSNIVIDGTDLYPVHAEEWVRLQFEGLDKTQERLYVDPSSANPSKIGMPLNDAVRAYVTDRNILLKPYRVVDVGFHVVFGIGLGLHLPTLVETTSARSLILIEPIPEFILHSMEVIDWQALFHRAEERRIKIYFALYDQPIQICRAIEGRVVNGGKPFLDGTCFYFHYYSWVLHEAYRLFRERHRNIAVNSGFFEDEVIMMTNAFGNFTENEYFQLADKAYIEQKAPLLVCGAGPSLATCLPAIKQWREHVVVMSCGTALGALLGAGIRPDFHCENENVPIIHDFLSRLGREHGLHGITLVASSTVHPSIPPLFERCWFYQRGALTATTILAPGVKPLHGVDPLVSNAGFAIGATVGFTTIYLLGTDCGAKSPDAHHVPGAYKFETEERYKQHLENFRKKFDREVPGNFGGKVFSAWHWDLSRRMFEEAQREHKVQLFNCSDGARIEGAKPRSPRSLRFDGKVNGENIRAAIERQMKFSPKGEFARTIDLGGPMDVLAEYRSWVEEKLAAAKSDGNRSFFDLFAALSELPKDKEQSWTAARSFVGPSVDSMVWVAAFFGDRIEDEEERQKYFDFFVEGFEERLEALFTAANEFLLDLKARAEEVKTV